MYKKSVLNNLPFVSVIIPCRNEEKFIGRCLDSVAAQDYPHGNLEILTIDGMSEDGTRKITKEYTMKYPFIKLLNNPKKITPCALNIGIKNTKGEIIVRMDAHAEYNEKYILKCVKYLKEFDADAVGGAIKPIPQNNSFIGKAICAAISHPFGVGTSAHKTEAEKKSPHIADTAFGICYKKEIFRKVGFFNEKLIRGQDMEFALRLKRAGLKTLLVPEIASHYYARSDLKSFIRHNFTNGIWAILPFKYTNIMPVSLRHLIPLIFVLSLIGFGISAFFSSVSLLSFLLIVISYSLCNLGASFQTAIRKKDLKLLFLMPLIFFIFHFSYGLGSFWGLIKYLKKDKN